MSSEFGQLDKAALDRYITREQDFGPECPKCGDAVDEDGCCENEECESFGEQVVQLQPDDENPWEDPDNWEPDANEYLD